MSRKTLNSSTATSYLEPHSPTTLTHRSNRLSTITHTTIDFIQANGDRLLLGTAIAESTLAIIFKTILISQLVYTTQQFLFRLFFGIIFVQAFQLFYVVDTIRTKNMFQLVGLVGLSIFDMTMSISELKRIAASSSSELVYGVGGAMFAVQLVCFLVFVVLMVKLYAGYSWHIYKRIGADLRMRYMVQWYHACVMLIKMLIYVMLPFIVDDVLDDVEDGETMDILILHLVALGGVPMAVVLAYFSVKRESGVLNAFALSFMAGLVAYLGCMVYLAVYHQGHVDMDKLVQSIIGIVMTGVTIVVMVKCQLNYGRGLKALHQGELDKQNSFKQISRSALLDDHDSLVMPRIMERYETLSAGQWKRAVELELKLVVENVE